MLWCHLPMKSVPPGYSSMARKDGKLQTTAASILVSASVHWPRRGKRDCPFITFAIELFDALDSRGWPRLPAPAVPPSRHRYAIESFPTSGWRSLGLVPLPGKAATAPEMVLARLQSLRAVFPLDVANNLSHDELQALVAGLAGVALDDGNVAGVSIAGVPPKRVQGTWREGFIVNPTRKAAG